MDAVRVLVATANPTRAELAEVAQHAARRNSLEMLEVAHAAGAPLDKAVESAARQSRLAALQWLLEHGADPRMPVRSGDDTCTLAHIAAKQSLVGS